MLTSFPWSSERPQCRLEFQLLCGLGGPIGTPKRGAMADTSTQSLQLGFGPCLVDDFQAIDGPRKRPVGKDWKRFIEKAPSTHASIENMIHHAARQYRVGRDMHGFYTYHTILSNRLVASFALIQPNYVAYSSYYTHIRRLPLFLLKLYSWQVGNLPHDRWHQKLPSPGTPSPRIYRGRQSTSGSGFLPAARTMAVRSNGPRPTRVAQDFQSWNATRATLPALRPRPIFGSLAIRTRPRRSEPGALLRP